MLSLAIDHKTEVDLASLLARMVEFGGSDLLLKVGNRPLVRIRGALEPVDPDHDVLDSGRTEHLLYTMISSAKIKDFETNGEIDFAYSAPGLGRFRVSAYKQRGSVSIAMRIVPTAHGTIESLGLPNVLRRLADEERGLILVTGGTGSGKSTTLAAMIGHINETHSKHIITIEDPIEFLHRDRSSAIDQREVGNDTGSFGNALRRVLRQDPDVILIGEMRDEETVRTALSAAETGHLVMSTLHTLDAGETINRIIDFFQPHEHQQVRAMLAGTLKGIISQRLAPTADGEGRVAICEVLTTTGRVHDAILNPDSDMRLSDIIVEGEYYGMQTFDQALFRALAAGKIDMDTAMRISSHPHDLKLLIQANGRVATTMDDLQDSIHAANDNGPDPSSGPPAPKPPVSDPDRTTSGPEQESFEPETTRRDPAPTASDPHPAYVEPAAPDQEPAAPSRSDLTPPPPATSVPPPISDQP